MKLMSFDSSRGVLQLCNWNEVSTRSGSKLGRRLSGRGGALDLGFFRQSRWRVAPKLYKDVLISVEYLISLEKVSSAEGILVSFNSDFRNPGLRSKPRVLSSDLKSDLS